MYKCKCLKIKINVKNIRIKLFGFSQLFYEIRANILLKYQNQNKYLTLSKRAANIIESNLKRNTFKEKQTQLSNSSNKNQILYYLQKKFYSLLYNFFYYINMKYKNR